MPLVFALLALVLIVALALVLSGRLPSVPQPTRDRYIARLPDAPTAADVDQLRLPVAFRGYRMDEVDIALATLRNRIADLQEHLDGPPRGKDPAPPFAAPVSGTATAPDPASAFAPPEPPKTVSDEV